MLGFTLGLGLTKIIPYVVYVGVVIVAVLALFRPRFALICTIPLLPFRVVLFHMYQFPLGKDAWDILIMMILIGTVLNSHKLERLPGESQTPMVRLIKFKIVFLVISLFIGAAYFGLGNPIDLADRRFLELKNYILLPILFLLTHRLIRSKKDVQIVLLLMVAVLFVADLKYAFDNRYRVFSSFSWDYKDAGIFAMLGGNVLAAFKAHFIFLPLAMFYHEKKLALKALFLGTVALTIYPIMFLFSRGAYAALYAGIVYFGFKRSKALLLLAIVIPVFWATLLPVAVVERIEMTQSDGGELDSSASQRIDLWKICMQNFASSPLFGVGYDTFHLVHSRDDPHNVFFEILGEQGLIGMVLILGMFAITIRGGLWLNKNTSDPVFRALGLAAPAVVLACAITNLFGDRWSYLEIGAFFFVLMALVSKARIIAAGMNADETVKASA